MSAWEALRSLGMPPVKPRDSRTCEICKRPMTPIFMSLSCNHCDSPPKGVFYVGYVALRVGREKELFTYYVWYSRGYAEAWGASLPDANEVRVVLNPNPFFWTNHNGAISADKTYQVMPDHRYEPKPCHAFLAPKSVPLDCPPTISL